MRFAKHLSDSTRNGDRVVRETKILGVWFYRSMDTQKWSPLMHEVEHEIGIRIGYIRLTLTTTKKHFFDGKEPSVVRGPY